MPGERSRQGPCVTVGKSPNSGSGLQFLYRQPGFDLVDFFGKS